MTLTLRAYCLIVTALTAITVGAAAQDVTIYRCTDGKDRLSLRDTPCRKGEHQQVRTMVRPSLPKLRAATPSVRTITQPASQPPPQVVVVQAPRPLYECITDDGTRYTSETGTGNPRWVPLAILGYHLPSQPLSYGLRLGQPGYQRNAGTGPEPILGGAHRYPQRYGGTDDSGRGGFGLGYPAGTWIRDACYALPPQEVCARLGDRREELDRRYNSALQSERNQITLEQRGIDARLSTECRMY